jgi:hypothetical protein
MKRVRGLRLLCSLGVVAAALVADGTVLAATKTINLDGKAANGNESQIDLNVLQTFPPKIECKVTNRAVGDAFTFKWSSAGPGGFSSSVAAGSVGGVGAKWVWTTCQTVYSFTGSTCPKDVCFTQTAGTDAVPSRGPFSVPGRSQFTTDVTVSAASLTSSLITFFSPPKEVFRATSTAQPGGTLDTLQNVTASPVTVTTEAYPPGCCPANPTVPHQLNCSGSCVDYLSDPNNCGACGSVCGQGTCCANGSCASLCGSGQAWCNGACYDLQNDSNNCGACGNVCGAGSCCTNGACASVCSAGRNLCNGQCYDLQNDPKNCGACGNSCGAAAVCTAGACVTCDGHAGAKWACDNTCVNENTDPYNCGACGSSCNTGCPSDFHGVCSSGNSCSCVAGSPAPPPPPHAPGATAPSCPNPHPVSGALPSVCPNPGPPAPNVTDAPTCQINPSTQTIPPGGSSTTCRPGGVLFKEVTGTVSVCGDGLPGIDGQCANGISKVSTGTFERLVPDTSKAAGNAYVTPYAVHVIADTSNDGMIEPGESASLIVDVVNAGPMAITGASATLGAPSVDLTDDGVNNPVGVTVGAASSSYGTIPGTPVAGDCSAPAPQVASNAVPFQITVPSGHPGDTAHPFILSVTGTVGGAPFSMNVPIALGIADKCDPAASTRDYDGLDGLLTPLTKLVPAGDAAIFPSKALNAGKTAPLKVRLLCGGANLTGSQVDAPQIVALSEATRGPLDIAALTLNDDANSNDPFFRWNDNTKQWIYNMRTSQLGTGTFTLTLRIAGRKDYVAGFVLR